MPRVMLAAPIGGEQGGDAIAKSLRRLAEHAHL
jgi:hypothetical protein